MEDDAITKNVNNDDYSEGINWYEGELDSAFKKAKANNKLVFLYWGAIWCPPCNQLKATVFKDQSFIQKTRLFVPVYLDGDTERAQIYGEKYAVSGYPTLIVMDADQNEITRIPGGMDLRQYEKVLDLVLAERKPVSEIVANLQAGEALSQNDFSLLAAYSWGQDKGRILPDVGAADLVLSLFSACPQLLVIEKSRLFSAWWFIRKRERDDEGSLNLNEAENKMVLQQATVILSDSQLQKNNLDFIFYDRGDVLKVVDEVSAKRLSTLWEQALVRIEQDDSLGLETRLYPWYARMFLENVNSGKDEFSVSEQLAAKAQAAISQALSKVNNTYEHSAVMNRAWYMLTTAGLHEQADAMLKKELENSATPYYFMIDLAESAKELGREDEAIKWLGRAYSESKQGATRFQWGVMYLEGLVEMKPDNDAAVVQLVESMLDVLQGRQDAFFNRNLKRVKRIEKALTTWSESGGHTNALQGLLSKTNALCGTWSKDSEALSPEDEQLQKENHSRCKAFATTLETLILASSD